MEYLSKDILDEGFIKSFAPFHWFQMVLGSCRVDVRDSFATTPTVWQKLYTAVLIIMSSAAYVSFVLFYPLISRGSGILLYITLLAILGLHNLVNICNIFHVRFVNNDRNVQFLIRLHEIDKSMGIDRKAYIHDVFFNVNLVTVVVWSLIPTSLFLFTLASDWLEGVCYIWIYYAQITCAFEWMYFSNLIVYFYIRLRYINSIMINHLGIEDTSYLKMYKLISFMHKTTLKDLAAETGDFASSDMVLYLNQIFHALTQFASLYRFQMFFCCVKFIIASVLSVEFYLLILQMNVNLGLHRFIGPIIWVGDFVILGVICLRWDDFFFELRETKNLATKILATHTSGPLRKRASMMIKLIKESSPHFSVYDMWNMDASTLLNMLGVLTTLTVTQMQFALL